ncbi:uncharacterized protein BJ212DRAFT_1302132 [Suillus subaureus]|uniref:Uncharacterized protein n=1 Tax=Suillus subaureus TaxID=48587 RepID=A0A9P7E4W0_9AGAM|nr:uncharacterized protein BJ212DRAFT_1302132 [Suillus subaureus]KAG1811255.1 hypothetical protein BJ212DRAFT_1302132 [Suillus subaureus]
MGDFKSIPIQWSSCINCTGIQGFDAGNPGITPLQHFEDTVSPVWRDSIETKYVCSKFTRSWIRAQSLKPDVAPNQHNLSMEAWKVHAMGLDSHFVRKVSAQCHFDWILNEEGSVTVGDGSRNSKRDNTDIFLSGKIIDHMWSGMAKMPRVQSIIINDQGKAQRLDPRTQGSLDL